MRIQNSITHTIIIPYNTIITPNTHFSTTLSEILLSSTITTIPRNIIRTTQLKMSGDLVLLTGATGFLGYQTLIQLIKSGYKVRAAVRSLAKTEKIRNGPSFKALAPTDEQLSFVSVPDMTAKGAFDEAVKGVKYIVHIASPIPTFGEGEAPAADQLESVFVGPARAGVVGLLESANAAPGGTVKRVVVTSSAVANVPFYYFMGQGKDLDTRIFNADERIPVAEGPYGFEFAAYSAGKAAALAAVDDFVRDNKTTFDAINILPAWIFGTDELVSEAANMRAGSTNSVLLGVVTGVKSEIPNTGNAVKGSDVALAHVRALDPKVAGNQSFGLSSDIVWEDAITLAQKYHPEAFKNGQLSSGTQPTLPMHWDVSKTEKILGIKLAGFDQMVKEVTDEYLQLLTKA